MAFDLLHPICFSLNTKDLSLTMEDLSFHDTLPYHAGCGAGVGIGRSRRRKLARRLYLLVKGPDGSWNFPQSDRKEGACGAARLLRLLRACLCILRVNVRG
jgi:hypothetical protein